jgi:hypothetical protein
MKKTLFILCLLSSVVVLAQTNPIVVQNGNTLRYASSLDSAIIAASSGDTIYLPAGVFAAPSGAITKKLAIFGVGYRADSSRYSGTTVLTGTLTLGYNNSSFLTGLNILETLFLDRTGGVKITNCKIQNLQQYYLSGDNVLRECVIGTIPYYSTGNLRYTIHNSIIEGSVYCGYVNILNSTFLNANSGALFSSNSNQAYLANNIIFVNNTTNILAASALLQNNLIVGSSNFGLDTLQNTYRSLSFRNGVFVRYGGTIHNESNDYHTQSTCAECAGLGIYNGLSPFRPLPNTPQVLEKEVSGSTTNNYLRFKIKLRLPTN